MRLSRCPTHAGLVRIPLRPSLSTPLRVIVSVPSVLRELSGPTGSDSDMPLNGSTGNDALQQVPSHWAVTRSGACRMADPVRSDWGAAGQGDRLDRFGHRGTGPYHVAFSGGGFTDVVVQVRQARAYTQHKDTTHHATHTTPPMWSCRSGRRNTHTTHTRPQPTTHNTQLNATHTTHNTGVVVCRRQVQRHKNNTTHTTQRKIHTHTHLTFIHAHSPPPPPSPPHTPTTPTHANRGPTRRHLRWLLRH